MLTWMPARLKQFILALNHNKHTTTNYASNKRNGDKFDNVLQKKDLQHPEEVGTNGKNALNRTFENSPSTGLSRNTTTQSQSSQIDRIVNKADLIYHEVKTFNRAAEANNAAEEDTVLENNILLAKFLDNLFIVAALCCVAIAVLVEVYI